MSKKNKNIDSKTWRLTRLALLAIVLATLGLSLMVKNQATIEKIEIDIEALEDNKYLISKNNIKALIQKYQGYDLENVNIESIDIHNLEKLIQQDKRIETANLFVDKHNRMHIDIVQKNPVVRVSSRAGDFYLDNKGNHIPSVSKVAVRVPVATGAIDNYDSKDVFRKESSLYSILKISKYIKGDEFLSSLIEQIDINSKKEITLVPKVGRNKIEFGTIDNMEDKFYRLKIYYKEGVQKVGLNKFSVLNLKYENQLVGVKNKS